MARRLCRCADHQGSPISAVGLPLPPPYARSPSLEFHAPPIKVHPIDDTESVPSSPAPVPVPPPAPRTLLQPIEKVVSDVEDSDAVAERLEDQIGDEIALSLLNGSNQG